MESANAHPLATSWTILRAILAVAVVLILVSAVLFQSPETLGRDKVLTDFDAFHLAGTMALEGDAAATYRAETMSAAQQQIVEGGRFLPWTYPPPFTLFVAGLALLPIGWAYALFTSLTFLFYLAVLRRIAGPWLPGVLIAILPTIVLTLRTGQNGFLTGALVGTFLLAFLDRKRGEGIPLGLMIVKPHLNVGMALLALLERRWTALFGAAAVVVATLAVSTAVFGIAIWPAFMQGVRESSAFLAEGFYPLFRMTSVYATLRSFGLSADMSLAFHAFGALIAIGFFVRLWWQGLEPRLLAAIACITSLFVSPYNYDYDLSIMGIAIAFVMPHLLASAKPLHIVGLVLLCWFATGYGLVQGVLKEAEGASITLQSGDDTAALIAPALLLLVGAAVWVIRHGGTWNVTDRSEPTSPARSA